jgi:hypothetical protein
VCSRPITHFAFDAIAHLLDRFSKVPLKKSGDEAGVKNRPKLSAKTIHESTHGGDRAKPLPTISPGKRQETLKMRQRH